MEKRLIYPSMAATGFISVQKRLERWLSNESRNKCWNMSHSFLITTAHYKNCMEIINLYKLRQKSDAKVSQLKLMKTTNISKVSNTGDLSSSLFTYITKICTYIMYMYDWMDGWMDGFQGYTLYKRQSHQAVCEPVFLPLTWTALNWHCTPESQTVPNPILPAFILQ